MTLGTEEYLYRHGGDWAVDNAAHKAIADVQAGGQVVCTIEEYYTAVRMALQRYAVVQAALGNPDVVARVTAEIARLDKAQTTGRWPGTYRSIWEQLFVWCGGRYATRSLGRRYYRRARGFAAQSQPSLGRGNMSQQSDTSTPGASTPRAQ